jgi:hypothetical protein
VFFDEPFGIGVIHQLSSAFASQLFQNVFSVGVDGMVAKVKLIGNFAGRSALGHER